MADKQYYIESVFQKLNNGQDELEMLLYLQKEGLDTEDCREIIEAALSRKREADMPKLAKKHRLIFMLWIALTVLVLIADFFILPDGALIDYKFILCLLGTAALAVCCHFCILYYKTWTTAYLEKQGEVQIQFRAFPLLVVPGVVVYFLISWRFSSAADVSLAKDMIKTKGIIVSGYSIGSRRGDLASTVTVRFHTKEGKMITTTEDVSSYAFRNFYEGQEVDMVYSKSNPDNVDLLTSESDVKDLTQSEERDINPADLFALMDVAPADMEARLDKITFGWKSEGAGDTWINEKKQLAIKVNPQHVTLMATQNTGIIFPKRLTSMGFKASDPSPRQPYSLKPQLFENDAYLVSIAYKNMEGDIISIIEAAKK